MSNPKSTLTIAGHPIHVMLIPFPIAFYVAALVCDLAFWNTRDPGWTEAALWLLGVGIGTHALAAAVGIVDFLGEPRIRALDDAWQHMIGNSILLLIQLYNFYHHYAFGATGVLPVGLSLSLIGVLLLLFNGWKGWNLVQKHRVGVSEDAEVSTPLGRQNRPSL